MRTVPAASTTWWWWVPGWPGWRRRCIWSGGGAQSPLWSVARSPAAGSAGSIRRLPPRYRSRPCSPCPTSSMRRSPPSANPPPTGSCWTPCRPPIAPCSPTAAPRRARRSGRDGRRGGRLRRPREATGYLGCAIGSPGSTSRVRRIHRRQLRFAARSADAAPGQAGRARRIPSLGQDGGAFHHRRAVAAGLHFPVPIRGRAPQRALAVYAVIAYMDTVCGVYFPRGGMRALPDALAAAAADAGVQFRYGSTVRGLERSGERRALRVTDRANESPPTRWC